MNKLLGSILLLLFSLGMNAQDRSPLKDHLSFKARLQQQAKETTSIVADFTQEKHVSFMKDTQFSEGVFYYKQTDKMRWEQNNPFNYVLLINEGKVRIKDNGKEKNIAGGNKIMDKMNTLMLGLINGDIFENKDFTSQYLSTNKYYIIELTPKNKRLLAAINKIELSFSKKTTRLKELTFFEKSGDKSVMKFFNEKFNQSIEQSIFLNL